MMVKTSVPNPYTFGCLGSLEKGENVLLCQYDFPTEYDRDKDVMTQADHDRCFQWDFDHARATCKKHLGAGELAIGRWSQTARKTDVIAFLKDILKADPNVEWTGCRVTGTVNRSNGYPVFSLYLYAKR